MPLPPFNSRQVVNQLDTDMELPLHPSLSRIMSLNDQNDSSFMGATSINAKKCNGNENDIFSSNYYPFYKNLILLGPKPFMNGNKEDDVSNMYQDFLQVNILIMKNS